MRTDYTISTDDSLLFDRVRHRAYACGCVQVSITPCRESYLAAVLFKPYGANTSENYRLWWVSWTFDGEECCKVYDRIQLELLFRTTGRKTKCLRRLESGRYYADMLFPELRGVHNG